MIASASEDLFIDIVSLSHVTLGCSIHVCDVLHVQGYVESGEKIYQIPIQAPTFTVSWHPKKHLLAYACDDKVCIV